MSITDDQKEWDEFLLDFDRAKSNRLQMQAALVERLSAMIARRNVVAIREAARANVLNEPGGKVIPSRFWEIGGEPHEVRG